MNAFPIYSSCLTAALGVAVSLFMAGCGHQTAIVTAENAPPALTSTPASVPVIPFYVKRGMCKRQTVWAEPRYSIQLDILESGKPVITRTISFPRSFLGNGALNALLENLQALAVEPKAEPRWEPKAEPKWEPKWEPKDEHKWEPEADQPAQPCPSDVAARWDRVAAQAAQLDRRLSCDLAPEQAAGCESLEHAAAAGNILRVSNTATIVAEVDYEHRYYLNSRTPWIGTAQANAKLNADGTLSEGSAQTTDQTWSTVLGSVSSLAGSFATYASAAVAARAPVAVTATAPEAVPPPPTACTPTPGWPAPSSKVAYRITPATVVYLHDHVKEDEGLGSACTPASSGVTDGNVIVSKLDAGPAKKDDKTIQVSGEVKLPKSGDEKK